MFCETSFDCDSEFMKLLCRGDDIDLAVAALEIARDAQPGLEFAPTLDWIEDRSRELVMPIAMATTERGVLEALSHGLAEVHGLRGDDAVCCGPESSYLNRVVETRRGLPITLSILYSAIARRSGIELTGVCAPMHFLLRYESIDGPLFVDAYNGGRVLEPAECTEWLSDLSGLAPRCVASTLVPADPRAIVVRVLNNLKSLHVRNQEWRAAWNVQHRLTVLNPSAYSERRDLAHIALRANMPGAAVELLECCLKNCPPEDTNVLKAEFAEANRMLARCN